MSQLGMRGEHHFAAVCSSQNAKHRVTINKANNDQHGWDYIVEVEPTKNNLPADLQPLVFQCLVQIKATEQLHRRTKVKLSNAIKAAHTPFPMFIFLIKYQASSEVPKIYGKHIWQEEIELWLRKAREASLKKGQSISKTVIQIDFNESNIVNTTPGDWMISQVEKHGGSAYAENKTKLVQTVGYRDCVKSGTGVIGPIESLRDLALHEVGLLDDLPLVELKMHDIRFGIKSPEPTDSFENGRISLKREPTKVEFRCGSIYEEVSRCEAEMLISSLVGLNHPETRLRVNAGCVDFTTLLNITDQKLDVKFRLEEDISLTQLAAGINCWFWIQNGGCDISVHTDQGIAFSGFGRDTSRQDTFIEPYRHSLSHAVQVFGDDKAKNIRLKFSDARDIVEAFSLSSQITKSSYFRLQSEFNDHIESFQELACYTYGSVRDWSFGVIYSAKLRERSIQGKVHDFVFAPLKSHKVFLYQRPLREVKELVMLDFVKWRKSRNFPTAMCMEGDLRELYLGLTTDGLLRFDVDDFSLHGRE